MSDEVGAQMIFEWERVVLYGEPLDLEEIYIPPTGECEGCGEESTQLCEKCGCWVCFSGECMDVHEEASCHFWLMVASLGEALINEVLDEMDELEAKES